MYCKWLHREIIENGLLNKHIADEIKILHKQFPDKEHHPIRADLKKYHNIRVDGKRVLRIWSKQGIKLTIKYANNVCTH